MSTRANVYQTKKLEDFHCYLLLLSVAFSSGALKMTDMKIQDMKMQGRKLAQKRQTSEAE